MKRDEEMNDCKGLNKASNLELFVFLGLMVTTFIAIGSICLMVLSVILKVK